MARSRKPIYKTVMCLANVPYFQGNQSRAPESDGAAGDIVAKAEAAGLAVAILTAHLGIDTLSQTRAPAPRL